MDDKGFLAVLEKVRPHVIRFFSPAEEASNTVSQTSYESLVNQVRHAMSQHSRYSIEENRFLLDTQLVLTPYMQAMNTVEMLHRRNPQEVMAWYDRVLETTEAEVIVLTCVEGVNPNTFAKFNNRVEIIPLTQIPDSPEKSTLIRRTYGVDFVTQPFTGAIAKVDLGRRRFSKDHRQTYKLYSDTIAKTSSTLTALSAFGMPIFEMASWAHIDNADILEARIGTTIKSNREHPRGNLQYLDVNEEMIEFVNKIWRFDKAYRQRALNALRRFNVALLQTDVGDKALDICIALEMLFGDNSPESQSFKIRMRAALLMSDDPATRMEIDRRISHLYRIRSSAAHGGRPNVTSQEFSDLINLSRNAVIHAINRGKDIGRIEYTG